jgi:tRNA pseudouridine55 synthase
MKSLVNIYKPIGITPLQLIEGFKEKFSEYENEKIGYAGRLDPMAHGVTLLLVGEENKNRDKYLNLPKTYKFSVLFGVETDSYDFLGILKKGVYSRVPENYKEKIKEFIKKNTGKRIQAYPPYSTKTVQGKPLFKWAREDRLSEIEIPEREIEIYCFKLLSEGEVPLEELEENFIKRVKLLEGDFRQEEIIKMWKTFFEINRNQKFIMAKFEIDCSSGTYVRSLAHRLGQELGCGAIAYFIFRTKVGEYTLDKSLNLEEN